MAVVRHTSQLERDRKRRTYRLVFPAEVKPEQVGAYFEALSGILRPKVSFAAELLNLRSLEQGTRSTPSIVLETWGLETGIEWRLKMPYGYESPVRMRLESLVPGIQLTREPQHLTKPWMHAVELMLHYGHRPLAIGDPVFTNVSLRSAFSDIAEGEAVVLQMTVVPMLNAVKPAEDETRSIEFGLSGFINGGKAAKDEIRERRRKLDQKNFLCSIRVAAVASSPVRASYIVRNVTSVFESTGTGSTYFKKRQVPLSVLQKRIDQAVTPVTPKVQLTSSELTCLTSWPLGDMIVLGQPTPAPRRLPAPNGVPKAGRILGTSNYPGRERVVAQPYSKTSMHTHIIGATGSGKSTLMANMARQDMENGFGLVVIDSKDLVRKVLDYVPPGRVDDVIIIDLTDYDRVVGFNYLEQANPRLAANELTTIFGKLFAGTATGLWLSDVMRHGIPTLMLDPKNTLMDLPALFSPNSDQVAWRDDLIRQIRDPFLKAYWRRTDNMERVRQDQKADPMITRFGPLTDQSIRNVLGQSKSSFMMSDVVQNGKILLINLGGVDQSAAGVLGTLFLNCLWSEIQRHSSSKGIQLYADEFQRFLNIPIDAESMFAEARSMGLHLNFAHQQLAQIKDEGLKQSIMTNARTKLVLNVSRHDAHALAEEVGKPIAPYDLINLPSYEMVARVMTDGGPSAPFTLQTLAAPKGYGQAGRIRYTSLGRYSRPVHEVEREIANRHVQPTTPRRRRAQISGADV